MKTVIAILSAALVVGAFFAGVFYQKSKTDGQCKKQIADTVAALNAFWIKALNDCESKFLQSRPPMDVSFPMKPSAPPPELGEMSLDSCKKLLESLLTPRSGSEAWSFEDEYQRTDGYTTAYYEPGADSIKTETRLTWFQLKKLPRDTVRLAVPVTESTLLGGWTVRIDIGKPLKNFKTEWLSSAVLTYKFNLSQVTLSPHAGFAYPTGGIVGLSVEVKL